MLSNSVDHVSKLILKAYPKHILTDAYKNFEWQKIAFEGALNKRYILENELKFALSGKNDQKIEESIRNIYYWGFRKKTPNTKDNDWISSIIDLVKIFQKMMMRQIVKSIY